MSVKNTAAQGSRRTGTKQSQKIIFISWSRAYSKQIALELKVALEEKIFSGTELKCFVSDVDIASGEDWWKKIETELKNSGMGILCVTKQNVKEPWIFFEAGALVANNINVVPLLISCDLKQLEHSPLNAKECVQFYEENKFLKMVQDINRRFKLLSLNNEQLNIISKEAYKEMRHNLKDVLEGLKASRFFSEKYIYPNSISSVNMDTVYISAPMSSISDVEYGEQRQFLIRLEKLLREEIQFRDVICPAIRISDKGQFDGNTKAIKENFINIKQVDHSIVLYPKQIPTSALIETGYGLALTKQTVIFYREGLPYMLKEAGETIQHIRTVKFDRFDDILEYIKRNGRTLFHSDSEE